MCDARTSLLSKTGSERVAEGGSDGLWERVLASEVYTWYVVLGWLAFRRMSPSPGL